MPEMNGRKALQVLVCCVLTVGQALVEDSKFLYASFDKFASIQLNLDSTLSGMVSIDFSAVPIDASSLPAGSSSVLAVSFCCLFGLLHTSYELRALFADVSWQF